MSVFFEGNAFIDEGKVLNTTIGNSYITTSSIDMNLENITNVKDPILPQDAATKKYVDDIIGRGVLFNLTSTTGTLISSKTTGAFVVNITFSDTEVPGPSAIFQISKTNPNYHAHVVRTVSSAGLSLFPGEAPSTTLLVSWPIGNGIYLYKSTGDYDGDYLVKIT